MVMIRIYKTECKFYSHLGHFVRTSEFVDDLEEYMDGADFANAGDEWDQETQDILDSEEDEDDYDNQL